MRSMVPSLPSSSCMSSRRSCRRLTSCGGKQGLSRTRGGGGCHTACLAQCHVNAHAPAESSTRKELRHLIEKQKKNSQRGTHSARPPGGRGVASPFALEGGNTKLLCSFSHLRFCWERSALSLLAILLLRSQFDDPWGAQFLKSTCR